MTVATAEKRKAFRALHQEGCFVLPNPWDAGSARLLQSLGFSALASTSSGCAWTLGRPDYGLTRDDVLSNLAMLVSAVDLPVNADFEAGFASRQEGVVESVQLALKTGVAGLSIEDRDVSSGGLYERAVALERLRAARAAIDGTGEDVMLVARTERLLDDPDAVSHAIDSLVAFADAGADCLYAPGVWKKADIAAMVRAVAPKPLNVLVFGADVDMRDLAELGVRRISVGGSLAAVGWRAVIEVAEAVKTGDLSGVRSGVPGSKLNDLFGGFPAT